MPDPDLEIRGRGAGSVSKNFFSALWASVWSKNKRGVGPLGPSLGSATDYCLTYTSVGCTTEGPRTIPG